MSASRIVSRVVTDYSAAGRLLVFPSEVVAGGWRRRLADEYGTVRSDRIISWDAFKERVLPIKRDLLPASRLIRRAFARRLLSDNAEAPFLSEIVRAEFARDGAASASAVSRMLPVLPLLVERSDALRRSLATDLREIRTRYEEFLAQHGLFEPNWELARIREPVVDDSGATVFMPELLEDFEDYRALLTRSVDLVTLHDAAEPATREQPVGNAAACASSSEEIEAACEAIEAAAARGVPLDRILVSAADLDATRPLWSAEMRRRGLPFRFAAGDAVNRMPGGRVFQRMQEVIAADFSVTAVAGLVMDFSVPWKRPEFLRLLIRFGYAAHCYRSSRWTEALAQARSVLISSDDPLRTAARAHVPITAAQLKVVESVWNRLRADLHAVAGAESARDLRDRVRRFFDRHVEPAGRPQWNAAGGSAERAYETARVELNRLVGMESRGVQTDAPWSFFLEALGELTYVQRAETQAIAIYPYRVAAGYPAELHCVTGLSHRATRVRTSAPLGVRSDELEALGWDARDRSRAFLNAYAGGGTGTRLTVALRGPNGVRVPAAELAVAGDESTRRRTAEGAFAQSAEGHRERTGYAPEMNASEKAAAPSAWKAEARWWRDDRAAPPALLYSPQAAGLARALKTTLRPAAPDFRAQPVDDKTLTELSARLDDGQGNHLSAGAVDTYLACPFSVFVKRMLGIRTERYGFDPSDRRLLGTLLHQAVSRILEAPDGVSAYSVVAELLTRPEARLLLPPAGREETARYAAVAIERLRAEPVLEAGRRGASEVQLTSEIGGVPITGYADRINGLEDDEPLTVIDFKLALRDRHRSKSVFGGDDADPWASSTLQLPIYAAVLALGEQRNVGRLVYVGLDDAEVRVIADSSAAGGRSEATARAGARKLEVMMERLPEFLGEVAAAIEAGNLPCRDEPDCSRCGIRSICRSCFVTRRFGDG